MVRVTSASSTSLQRTASPMVRSSRICVFFAHSSSPLHAPPAVGARYKKAELTVLAWNEKLEEAARSFSATHPDATVLIWSSWHLFTQMFNDPSSFGFTAEDLMNDGAVFVDGLHPTSVVHEIIAAQLIDFLLNISPPTKPTEDGL